MAHPPSPAGPDTVDPPGTASTGVGHGRRALLPDVRTVVVKVGSAVLAGPDGAPDPEVLDDLTASIARQMSAGRQVVLVSSGAIISGMHRLGFERRPRLIPDKQACAAVGQVELMAVYRHRMGEHGVTVAQVLLTGEDMRERRRFLNARNTLLRLLSMGVLPIVNENDTVSVDEIKLGDNDNLSSLVLNLVGGDLLVLLSDVDGFYTANPREDPAARLIGRIEDGDPRLEGPRPGRAGRAGTGGMATKIEAARRAMALGLPAVIASGRSRGIIGRILDGEETGTVFWPSRSRLRRRQHWIAYALRPRGRLVLDAGAVRAVSQRGKSLLPSGIVEVEGGFEVGDLVVLVGPDGHEVGRGLVAYAADDVRRIRGLHSSRIETVLGSKDYDEVVHRDNLVLAR